MLTMAEEVLTSADERWLVMQGVIFIVLVAGGLTFGFLRWINSFLPDENYQPSIHPAVTAFIPLVEGIFSDSLWQNPAPSPEVAPVREELIDCEFCGAPFILPNNNKGRGLRLAGYCPKCLERMDEPTSGLEDSAPNSRFRTRLNHSN